MTSGTSRNLSVSRGLPSRMIIFLLQEEQRFWTKNEDENSDFNNYNNVVWRIEWDLVQQISRFNVDLHLTCSQRTKRDQKRDAERSHAVFHWWLVSLLVVQEHESILQSNESIFRFIICNCEPGRWVRVWKITSYVGLVLYCGYLSKCQGRGRSSHLRYCTSSSQNAEVDEPEQRHVVIS